MKVLIITIILSIFISICRAEQGEDSSYQLPYNSVNVELLGNSYLYGSFNYERIVFHQNHIYISVRVGFGYLYTYNANIFSVPVLFNIIYNIHKTISLEGGVGTTLFYTASGNTHDSGLDPVLTGFLGMRVQAKKGFCFRVGFVPYYDFMDSGPNVFPNHFTPWGGVSFGYSFGKK
jgi:hypothetical protein